MKEPTREQAVIAMLATSNMILVATAEELVPSLKNHADWCKVKKTVLDNQHMRDALAIIEKFGKP